MTTNPSILGNPAAVPQVQNTPSQEERLLAVAAYLGYFLGFWLIVPIVIYVLKRDKSRFVAHHSLRAIVLHAAAVPVLLLSWMLGILFAFGTVSFVPEPGRGDHKEAFVALVWSLVAVGWLLPWVVYLFCCVRAAVRGFQGRMETRSLTGRMVERMLGQDKGVA